MFQILRIGLALGAASGLAGSLFPTASGLVISGLVLVGGLLWIAHRRGTLIAAIIMLLGFGFGACVTYDQAANSWWVGWVTTERAEMADLSAYSRKAGLAATVAAGQIRGRETAARVSPIMSAASTAASTYTTTIITGSGPSTVTTVMTSIQALKLLEPGVEDDREYNRRLEAVRQKLTGPPAADPPPPAHDHASAPPADPPAVANGRWLYQTVRVTAGQETKITAKETCPGWRYSLRNAGDWGMIRIRGFENPKFVRMWATNVSLQIIASAEKNPARIVLAAPDGVKDGESQDVILVFSPPGMNINDAIYAPLGEGTKVE